MDLPERKSAWHSASAGQHPLPSLSNPSAAAAATAGANVDPRLIDDLHEFLPLLQSLLDQDRKVSSSFTRRGTVTYTKTPARDSNSKKLVDPKGRNAGQSLPPKRRKDQSKTDNNVQDADGDGLSTFSNRTLGAELQAEELNELREQVEDLKRKLLDKEEELKSAAMLKNQMSSVQSTLEELKCQTAEKESLLKATQRQLSEAKIKLADKQAAVEKLRWEVMTSNKKVEALQEELNSRQAEMSAFMLLVEGLANDSNTTYVEDYDITPYQMDYIPEIDKEEVEMERMEEARKAYIASVAAAKENQDEESMAAAASARRHLQSFVLQTETVNSVMQVSQ